MYFYQNLGTTWQSYSYGIKDSYLTQSEMGTTVFRTMMQEKKTSTAMTVAPCWVFALLPASWLATVLPGTKSSHGRQLWKLKPTSVSHIPAQIVHTRQILTRKIKIYKQKTHHYQNKSQKAAKKQQRFHVSMILPLL